MIFHCYGWSSEGKEQISQSKRQKNKRQFRRSLALESAWSWTWARQTDPTYPSNLHRGIQQVTLKHLKPNQKLPYTNNLVANMRHDYEQKYAKSLSQTHLLSCFIHLARFKCYHFRWTPWQSNKLRPDQAKNATRRKASENLCCHGPGQGYLFQTKLKLHIVTVKKIGT